MSGTSEVTRNGQPGEATLNQRPLARAEDLPTLPLSELVRPRFSELAPNIVLAAVGLIGALRLRARIRARRSGSSS